MKRREPELDYLRFTSIFLVFLIHTVGYINIQPIQKFIVGIGAGNAVAVFYVISGYLAFAAYRDTSWKDYYKNRVLRIFIVYWFTFHINLVYRCKIIGDLDFSFLRYVIGLLGMQMAVPSYVYTWNGLGCIRCVIVLYIILFISANI